MWFNIADKELAFLNSSNIAPSKIGINCLACTEFFVIWEIVNLQIGVGLFVPLKGHRQIRNSKSVNTVMFCQIIHSNL